MTAFEWDMVLRLFLASILGGAIGLEREVHGRPAGFRTHLLVALGSSLFVVTSINFYYMFGNVQANMPVGVDPGRIAAQVVTGIGFLGAGAIIRERASIRGLTTAACLWVVAAIGVSCGAGLYKFAVIVTLLSLLSLLFLKRLEKKLSRDTYSAIRVWSDDIAGQMTTIKNLVEKNCEMEVMNVSVERDLEKRQIYLEFQIKYSRRLMTCEVIDLVFATPGVKRVRID